MNKNYINPIMAFIIWIAILIWVFWINYYYSNKEWTYKSNYTKVFNEVKEKKNLEANSEIKNIFNNIWKISNLVYSLSLFHVKPSIILDEVEKAIYIWKTSEWYYKVVTNENINFWNYNEISTGLITTDIENFATLIKKLKKMYNDTFEYKGMEDFWIERERDENWEYTWKIFYTTSLNLKYLKDEYSINSNIWEEGEENNIWKYANNPIAFENLNSLLNELWTKRKENWKKELYFSDSSDDNSIYLWTDIEYKDYNIYYITPENNLSDIFSLNWIWTKDLYDSIKQDNVKIILIVKKDSTKFSSCTKIEKNDEELTPAELQQKELKWTKFTKIVNEWEIDDTLSAFCELL